MKAKVVIILTICLITLAFHTKPAQAQTTEERFQDIFITAGYATAFGAALGAALLSFQENPAQHLRYVAVGASLGFIGGSIMGAYVVFSPLAYSDPSNVDGQQPSMLSEYTPLEPRKLVIRPVFNLTTASVTSVQAGMNLFSF